MVFKREKELNSVYSTNSAQDAEASVGQASYLSPRIESSRAPVSAPLSSDLKVLSAEADEVINLEPVAGASAEVFTDPVCMRTLVLPSGLRPLLP